MATQSEQMLLSVGMDQTGMDTGNRTLLQRAGETALKMVRLWGDAVKKAEADRQASLKSWNAAVKVGADNEIKIEQDKQAKLLAIEKAGHDARVAAYLAAEEKRIRIGKANYENTQRQRVNDSPERRAIRARREAAVNADIAAGSGAYGSGSTIGNTAGMAAEQLAMGGDLKTVGLLTGGAALGTGVAIVTQKAVEHSIKAGVVRESMVLVREALRGAYGRMLSSASLLLQYIGIRTAGQLATKAIPGIGMAADAYAIGSLGMEMYRGNVAGQEYQSSEFRLDTQSATLGARLQAMIDDLESKGAISKQKASILSTGLGGSYASVRATQIQLQRISGQFNAKQSADAAAMAAADEAYNKAKAQMDGLNQKERDLAAISKDIVDRNQDIEFLKKNVAALDQKSVDYHEARARLMEKEVQQNMDITRQKQLQADVDRQTAEWQKWSQGAARDWMRNKIEGAQDEAQYPTIENLAGRSWTKRFTSQYEAGGRFDLGAGDGPFASAAREYTTAKYQQMWDRTHGNMAAAEQDRRRMVSARDFLVRNGVASPAQMLGKIGDDTARLRELFQFMSERGMIIRDQD